MKALCIGKSSYNVIATVDKYPLENSKNELKEIVECGGGKAANIAYLLGKYGIETYLGSVVGDDTFGNIIKKELEKSGVHIEYMETAFEKRTPHSVITIGKENHSNTVFNFDKEVMPLKKNEFGIDPDIVIVDGYDYGASLAALNKFNNKITVMSASRLDPEVFELCKYCNYIIASKQFAEWLTNTKMDLTNSPTIVNTYSQFINKLPNKNVIITLGEKGALYMLNNQINVMPNIALEVVDTNAAGDFFAGAFGYALLQKMDLEKAVTFANILAGLSTTKIGTREAVPDISEVMQYFNQKYPSSTPSAPQEPQSTTQIG